uniref:Uncharacterized protein n=1 Tax=Anguilla anguilla TaxID=7936 RepID=A0A0E9S6U2_ANGAN
MLSPKGDRVSAFERVSAL